MVDVEQLKQRLFEIQFLAKHHEELHKHYLRESFNLELAIQQTQAATEAQQSVEEVEEQV